MNSSLAPLPRNTTTADDQTDEHKLEGGNLATVVRIGNTVRRPTGPWTAAVHGLLRHLQDKGFVAAPRVQGVDTQGREILSYLPGDTVGAAKLWPTWIWSDATLAAVGEWLAAYHDAVADFREEPGARWRMSWAPQRADEIICHFDVAPYNIVRSAGAISVIDWDVAAPGTATLELAKTANSFSPVHDVETQQRLGFVPGELNAAMLALVVHRARLLLDGYGLRRRRGFVAMMIAALGHSHQRIHRGAREGDQALAAMIERGVVDHLLETRALYQRYAAPLTAAIER